MTIEAAVTGLTCPIAGLSLTFGLIKMLEAVETVDATVETTVEATDLGFNSTIEFNLFSIGFTLVDGILDPSTETDLATVAEEAVGGMTGVVGTLVTGVLGRSEFIDCIL